MTKGAESHVLPLCQKSSRTLVAQTQGHINDFAKVGLRTLAVARRKMTIEEYTNFDNGKEENILVGHGVQYITNK